MRVLLAVACLLSGCSRRVAVENDYAPLAAELLAGDQSIGSLAGAHLLFDVPKKVTSPRDGETKNLFPAYHPGGAGYQVTPILRLRVTTGCGPEEFCLDYDTRSDPVQASVAGHYDAARGFCQSDVRNLWIDNRGGPARTISVGSWSHAVDAGATTAVRFPSPVCDAEAKVALDRGPIGLVSVHDSNDVFIDPSGARCYVATSRDYTPAGVLGGNGPSSTRLRGSKVYPVERRITDFLKESPGTIMTPGGFGTRTELIEQSCN
jgi:hypothetical protein